MPPPTLEYEQPEPPLEPRSYSVVFWVAHLVCTATGVFYLSPSLHTVLKGRPGDSGMFCLTLSSAGFVTAFLAIVYTDVLRPMRFAYRMAVGGFAGFAAFLPPYAVWLLT